MASATSLLDFGNLIKCFARCAIVSQNSLPIWTLVDFPTAKVMLVVRNEFPLDRRQSAIATRFSRGIALRKLVSRFSILSLTRSIIFRNVSSSSFSSISHTLGSKHFHKNFETTSLPFQMPIQIAELYSILE